MDKEQAIAAMKATPGKPAGNGKQVEPPPARQDDLLSRHNHLMTALDAMAESFGQMGTQDRDRIRAFVMRQHNDFQAFIADLIATKRADIAALERHLGVPPER